MCVLCKLPEELKASCAFGHIHFPMSILVGEEPIKLCDDDDADDDFTMVG